MKLENFSNYEIFPEEGRVYSIKFNRWIGYKNKDGYWGVTLYDDEGKQHHFPLHRLIWIAVKGDIPEDLQVNHIDENKDNNSISNLNLLTPKENANWGTRNQRMTEKRRNDPKQSKGVGAFKNNVLIMIFPSTREAERNGFNHSNISSCCRGERQYHRGYEWKYLT